MGRVRVLVGAYRGWAKLLAQRALEHLEDQSVYIAWTPDALMARCQAESLPDLVVLIGWSWFCPFEIYDRVPTLCLHPSPLPRYRGGSPLQHQIMNGEKESAVSIFRVTGEVDAGDIYGQCPISLEGSLADIFRRIVQVGAPMLGAIADAFLRGEEPRHAFAQEVDINPPRKRRTGSQSELTWEMATGWTSEQLRNFIRALDHPDYPRAFIRGCDGEKVELGWVP